MKRVLYYVLVYCMVISIVAQPPLPFHARPVPAVTEDESLALYFRASRFFTVHRRSIQVVKKKHLDLFSTAIQTEDDLDTSLQYGYFRVTRTQDGDPYLLYSPRFAGGGQGVIWLCKTTGSVIGGWCAAKWADKEITKWAKKAADYLEIDPGNVPPVFYTLYKYTAIGITVYSIGSAVYGFLRGNYNFLTSKTSRDVSRYPKGFWSDIRKGLKVAQTVEDKARFILESVRELAKKDIETAADMIGAPTVEVLENTIDAMLASLPKKPELSQELVKRFSEISEQGWQHDVDGLRGMLREATKGFRLSPTAQVMKEGLAKTLGVAVKDLSYEVIDSIGFHVVKTQHPHISIGIAADNTDIKSFVFSVDGQRIAIPYTINYDDMKHVSSVTDIDFTSLFKDRALFKDVPLESVLSTASQAPTLDRIMVSANTVSTVAEEVPLVDGMKYVSYESMMRQQPPSAYQSHAEMLNTYTPEDHPIVYRPVKGSEAASLKGRLPGDFDFLGEIKNAGSIKKRPDTDVMINEFKGIAQKRLPRSKMMNPRNYARGHHPKVEVPKHTPALEGVAYSENGIGVSLSGNKIEMPHPKSLNELMELAERECQNNRDVPLGGVESPPKFLSLQWFYGSKPVDCEKGTLYVAEYRPEFDRSGDYKRVFEKMVENTHQINQNNALKSFLTGVNLAGMSDVFSNNPFDIRQLERIKDDYAFIDTVLKNANKILNKELATRMHIQLQHDPGIKVERAMIQALDTDEIMVSVNGVMQSLDQNYTAIKNIEKAQQFFEYCKDMYEKYKTDAAFVAMLHIEMLNALREVAQAPSWSWSVSNKFLAGAGGIVTSIAMRGITGIAAHKGSKAGSWVGEGIGRALSTFIPW